jgi:hypothetical protein
MPATDAHGDAMVRVTLNWRDQQHYQPHQLACRICGTPTHHREAGGGAACKSCVEGEIETRVLAFAQDLIASAAACRHAELVTAGSGVSR